MWFSLVQPVFLATALKSYDLALLHKITNLHE